MQRVGRVRFRALRASAASALRRGQRLPLSPHYFSANRPSVLGFPPDKTGPLRRVYSSTGSACLIRERIREIVSPRQSPPEDRSPRFERSVTSARLMIAWLWTHVVATTPSAPGDDGQAAGIPRIPAN